MEQRLRGLDLMFNPRSIAFVGATEQLGKWGFIIFNNLITGGFPGKIYPVNPGRAEVLGYRAYPTVREVPGELDLVVIAAPAGGVLAAVEDCAAKGVKAVVVISAGFKEMGGAAAELEAEMAAKARAAGMVLVGPNGQGVCCPKNRVYPWMPHFFYPPAGPVAVVSQSGNVQGLMMTELWKLGIGVSKGVSSGNEADLGAADFLSYFGQDPDTKVILSYMEGLTDGRRFLEIGRETAGQKPVVLLKGGLTESGVSAAKSHTGALAVSDELFAAACRQAGLIRAKTIYEASVMAAAFVNRPLPRGRRVGIVTGGGGLGVIAADLCAQAGLTVPELSKDTLAKIAAKMPDWWVPGNPVDLVAGLNFGVVPGILETIMMSNEIDALLLLFIGPQSQDPDGFKPMNEQTVKMQKMWESMEAMYQAFPAMLGQMMDRTGVPIYVVSDFGKGTEAEKKVKTDPRYAVIFADLESACGALAAMAGYQAFRSRQAE